jgi:hypothetical protein
MSAICKYRGRASLITPCCTYKSASRSTGRISSGAVGQIDLRQPLEVFQGLKGFPLADEQVAHRHQRDLVLGLVLENGLILGDGLGNLALVQVLLGCFDVLGL